MSLVMWALLLPVYAAPLGPRHPAQEAEKAKEGALQGNRQIRQLWVTDKPIILTDG